MNAEILATQKKRMYKADIMDLMAIDIPEQTRTYKPMPHKGLVDYSKEAIDKMGFHITKEEYSMAKDGNQANGRYVIQGNDNEMALMIGWQNSYDKSLSLKFAIGGHVFICTNGMVSGDMGAFKKKHQGDVQEFTPAKIGEYIKDAESVFYHMQQDRNRMKEIEVTKRLQAELLGRMFIEDAVITATQLGIIKKELEAPTHKYEAPGSAWELYNYTTFSLLEEHPAKYFESHQKVHEFFKNQIV